MDYNWFDFLKNYYYPDWEKSDFYILPKDQYGRIYSSWNEVYNEYISYLSRNNRSEEILEKEELNGINIKEVIQNSDIETLKLLDSYIKLTSPYVIISPNIFPLLFSDKIKKSFIKEYLTSRLFEKYDIKYLVMFILSYNEPEGSLMKMRNKLYTELNNSLIRNYFDFKIIGSGGSGIVFSAFSKKLNDKNPNSKIAIKVRIDLEDNEIQILQKIQRIPGIPQIIDFGTIKDFGIDFTFFVMNFIERKEKQNLTKDNKLQLINILHQLHLKNIIHEDLHKDNVILDTNDKLWLIDFEYSKEIENNEDVQNLGYDYKLIIEILLLDNSNEKGKLFRKIVKIINKIMEIDNLEIDNLETDKLETDKLEIDNLELEIDNLELDNLEMDKLENKIYIMLIEYFSSSPS